MKKVGAFFKKVFVWTENPNNRKTLYKIMVASGFVLVATGVFTQEEVDHWVSIVGGLLLVGGSTVAHQNVNQ